MLLDRDRVRRYLKDFDFKRLFVDELGWDRHSASLDVSLDGQTFMLAAIAEKRGMVAFVCFPGPDDRIPEYRLRRQIEARVAKSVHQHVVVYVDAGKTTQVWQWVRREPGKPVACRDHTYRGGQSGEELIQRLEMIAFSLEDEETVDHVGVAARVRAAFDVERVTRRFYDLFKAEHNAFLKFLRGIPDEAMQRWYVSVMLNRLMFIYFVQKKGFLDGDVHYLRNRLADGKRSGADRFYAGFLCPLFFEGFAKRKAERSAAMNELLGEVPYLDGGLFQRHQIEERHGQKIAIPDAAFDRLFTFFDAYRWHLDDRPLRADNEINPDVLGYIFEKYINQKQMGAYYTKEDITDYIAKNTLVPFLFDAARGGCRIAFEGGSSVWRLLQENPDRYIYEAVRKGTDLPLPPDIAVGLNDVSKREEWNKSASSEYALPTETWREVVARRRRYEEVWNKLVAGDVHSVDDLITFNLDIRQFAQDVIEGCEGPELLRAFWHAIGQVSVLDPTCGSGAFLFAALNILEPLYEACLTRMEAFVEDLERSGERHRPEKFRDFKDALARVDQHPSRRYFILKSIVVNNLYGVDLMEEAVEICKLRLFLKLIAQIDRVDQIEPLPDIDFNIRAGNTLVGFVSHDEVQRALTVLPGGQTKLLSDEEIAAMGRIDESAELADRAFQRFREMQVDHGMEPKDFAAAKTDLRHRLDALDAELDRHLASQYGIDSNNIPDKGEHERRFGQWHSSHQPFHWFVEFYGILKRGGFDVIIGNPPYVEYSRIKREYTIRGYLTESCGNLYALTMERALALVRNEGRCGMIVPIASVSTEGMGQLQKLYRPLAQWHSHYAVRPGKLFSGVDMNLTISLLHKVEDTERDYVTGYRRWSGGTTSDRAYIFATLTYARNPRLMEHANPYPKLGSPIETQILRRMHDHDRKVRVYTSPVGTTLYYHSGGRYWRKAMLDKLSSHYKPVTLASPIASVVFCLLNSQLFYWYWISNSNCMDVVTREVHELPVFRLETSPPRFTELMERLCRAYAAASTTRVRRGERIHVEESNFDVHKAKPIIDEIDRVLAQHYGFTDEELDFIVNYDIKYRMGRDADEGDEG